MTATFACSLVVCFCTCTNTHVQKEEAPACRRAARSMVTRSLLFIVRLLCSPETCTLNINRSIRVQNNHASHSYTSTAVAPIIGDASQVCFPRKFFFLARAPDGGVRVGTEMDERFEQDEPLAHTGTAFHPHSRYIPHTGITNHTEPPRPFQYPWT